MKRIMGLKNRKSETNNYDENETIWDISKEGQIYYDEDAHRIITEDEIEYAEGNVYEIEDIAKERNGSITIWIDPDIEI